MSTRIKLSTYGFDKTIETSLRRSMSLTKVTCDHLQSQMLIFLSINDSSKDLFITFHDPYMFSHFCMSRNLYPFVVTFLLILDLTIDHLFFFRVRYFRIYYVSRCSIIKVFKCTIYRERTNPGFINKLT